MGHGEYGVKSGIGSKGGRTLAGGGLEVGEKARLGVLLDESRMP